MPHKSFRQESKADWGVNAADNYKLSNDELRTGCMLRIADATELMAKNYQQLQNNCDMYKRNWERERAENEHLRRRISALKGVISRLKKKKQCT